MASRTLTAASSKVGSTSNTAGRLNYLKKSFKNNHLYYFRALSKQTTGALRAKRPLGEIAYQRTGVARLNRLVIQFIQHLTVEFYIKKVLLFLYKYKKSLSNVNYFLFFYQNNRNIQFTGFNNFVICQPLFVLYQLKVFT